jgi:radical SAM protein with 4Fe4S-binding SPASM domain
MSGRKDSRSKPLVPSGLHHFERDGHRIHLRIESSGPGILTLDASRIIHLNGSASDMAWMILSGFPRDDIVRSLGKKYSVNRRKIAEDLESFGDFLEGVIRTGASEPVSFLNMDVREPFQTRVEVPYRIDLAITYDCNLKCVHCYNEDRNPVELSTAQWKEVMKKIWDLGVPHVIFTGGEATLREDLPELIGFGESLGMVTGLLTNGVRLADRDYVQVLLEAGLDHVQITLESSDRQVHNSITGADSYDDTVSSIRNCLEAGIHTITNTTITKLNIDGISRTAEFASELGLEAIAANAVIRSGRSADGELAVSPVELEMAMLQLNEKLDELGIRFIWYSPTRYCSFNPLEFSLGPKRCTAGEYNLCIEPDGEVLPCQSWYESAGNILKDPWDSIWNGPLLSGARNRSWADDECPDCVHFTLCGGGCALEKKNGVSCRDSM